MPFLFPALAPPPGLVAVGDWSAPVADDFKGQLRGRLRVVQGRFLDAANTVRETALYLELENVSDTVSAAIEIPFDLGAGPLRFEFKDARGAPLPPSQGGGSGGYPPVGPGPISIPYDSAVRLRANMIGYGGPVSNGLSVTTLGGTWVVKPGTVAYLSGTFTVVAPSGDAGFGKWQGTLKLPPVRLAIPKRPQTLR